MRQPGKKEVLVVAALFFAIFLVIGLMLYYDITPSHVGYLISQGGGYIQQITIRQVSTPTNWDGYYGVITATASTNQTIPIGGQVTGYNQTSVCPFNQTGEVYFSTVANPDFSTLVAGTTAQVDAFLGVGAADAASATSVFTLAATYEVNETNITAPSVTVESQSGTHTTGVLTDGANLVFVSNIQAGTGFNGETVDYQALIPTPGAVTFYTYTDPANRCPPQCGDGMCQGFENATNCVADCSQCGDSICDSTENANTCVADCSQCGDSICDSTENANTCVADCSVCGDSICDSTENASTCVADCSVCGDNICDITENVNTCVADCTNCGDSVCDSLEDANSCVVDCTSCGDNICDALENATTCVADCSVCGDSICDSTENANTCVADCSVCGDSICDSTETPFTCSTDCGPAPFCGDFSCNATVSEDCSTCSTDCGFCEVEFGTGEDEPVVTAKFTGKPEAEERTAFSGGNNINDEVKTASRNQFFGGGGFTPSLSFSPQEIYIEIERGGARQQSVRILNGLSKSVHLTPTLEGDIIDLMSSTVPFAIIRPGSNIDIPLFVIIPQRTNPGEYRGSVLFYDRQGKPRSAIPVRIKVVATTRAFNVDIIPKKNSYSPGSELDLEVTMRNVPSKDITYTFELIDTLTQKAVATTEGQVFVSSSLVFDVNLKTPRSMKEGKYMLRAQAQYSNEAGVAITSTEALAITISENTVLYYAGASFLMVGLTALLIVGGYALRKTDLIIKHPKTATLVLYDQFDPNSTALQNLDIKDFTKNKVVVIESKALLERKFEFAEKTDKDAYNRMALFTGRMRTFAKKLTERGFDVHYYKSDNMGSAVSKFIRDHKVERLYITATGDNQQDVALRELAKSMPKVVEMVH